MKNIKSKIILPIILIVLVFSIYYYKTYFAFEPITEIKVTSKNNISSIKTESDINFILDSFDSAKLSKEPSTHDFIPFNLKLINTSNKSYKKILLIDYNNEDIYVKDTDKNKLYKTKEKFENFYFTHAAFESIYKYRKPPTLKIISNEKDIHHTSNIDWSFKKLNDIYYSFSNTIESSNINNFTSEGLITFSYSEKPSKLEYKLFKGDSLVKEGVLKENSFSIPDENGNYSLNITALFNNKSKGFKGSINSKINLDLDLPPKFFIDKDTVYQGDIVKVNVKNLDPNENPYIKQNILKLFSFSENIDGNATGFIPISYYVSKGKYTIPYGVNNKELGSFTVNVLPRDFNIQYLTVDNTVEKNTRNDKAYEEFNKYYGPVRNKSHSKPYFDTEKTFMLPVKGRLTTEYGERRYVNNAPTSYRHSGLDIAAPAGTKVVASNSGKVKLSMDLILTGNSIVIDHGNGLFTTYYHLNKRHVKEGDMVNIGDEIGEVGSTGFSTGPHLHFMISCYNRNLDPGYFIYGEAVTYENYKKLFGLN
ncbi:M23 family metallopeptidase [Dethiothermospora halolimnae]|uniref:M23 family metallopeptidase n=1 Tax=Dethiothermospora halolimnae TaxID=3114390 RepID=UPI003CCB7938